MRLKTTPKDLAETKRCLKNILVTWCSGQDLARGEIVFPFFNLVKLEFVTGDISVGPLKHKIKYPLCSFSYYLFVLLTICAHSKSSQVLAFLFLFVAISAVFHHNGFHSLND